MTRARLWHFVSTLFSSLVWRFARWRALRPRPAAAPRLSGPPPVDIFSDVTVVRSVNPDGCRPGLSWEDDPTVVRPADADQLRRSRASEATGDGKRSAA